MNRTFLAIGGFFLTASLSSADSSIRNAPMNDAPVQVQARGLVHEAFAQLAQVNAAPAPVIPKAPPDPIPEVPPKEKPEAGNMQWVSGYWSWDAEGKDFVWTSGIWRAAPAERQWVPGHWAKGEDGWQWVPGFWADSGRGKLDYEPAPPQSLDTGPNVPPPNDNSFWVPGVWLPLNGTFSWRAGFWAPNKPGRVWFPSRWVWTPRGFLFVGGYWDYPLETRGILFAPVRFRRPLWADPNWSYQPAYAVAVRPLLNSLWANLGLGGYFFGDYYGPGYGALGFRPWYAYGRRFNDPLFSYYNWANRGNPFWASGLRSAYLARRNGTQPLPARTLATQAATRGGLQTVVPLNRMQNLAALNSAQRAAQRVAAQRMQNFGRTRAQLETAGRRPASSSLRLPSAGAAAARRAAPRISSGAYGRAASAFRSYYGSLNGSRGAAAVTRSGSGVRSGSAVRSGAAVRSAPSISRAGPSFRGGVSRGAVSRGGGGSRGGSRGGGGRRR